MAGALERGGTTAFAEAFAEIDGAGHMMLTPQYFAASPAEPPLNDAARQIMEAHPRGATDAQAASTTMAPPHAEEDSGAASDGTGGSRANSLDALTWQAAALLEEGDAEGALEVFFTFVFGEDWRDYFDAVPGGFEQAASDADVTFLIEGPAMGPWQAGGYDTSAVGQPVLVVWGEESHLAAPSARPIMSAFSNAEGVAIPATDHALITQAPAAVAGAMADFLARHPM